MKGCRALTDSFCNNWSHVRNMIVLLRQTRRNNLQPMTSDSAHVLWRTLTTAPPIPSPEPEEKAPLRAIDLAKKIRQEKREEERTTKGIKPTATPLQKRVSELKQFTQQLQNVHPNVLAKHLHKTLLFQNRDVIVLNKPYGVSVKDHGGGTCITAVLPILAKMMDLKVDSELQPCLGLEKEVTGTLLLARNQEAVDNIVYLHRHNQIQRKYWAVTVGVPVPSEGVIDIPLIEREIAGTQHHFKVFLSSIFGEHSQDFHWFPLKPAVNDYENGFTDYVPIFATAGIVASGNVQTAKGEHEVMGLSPMFRLNETGEGVSRIRAHRQAESAVTKYRVLDSRAGCSLVELEPLTGLKHQIRVHLACALGCPILGDHKYSSWTKLAPQKLPENVLGKLGLEKSKTRNLTLHLHARQMVLPGTTSQPEIRVSCPMPKYFTKALQRLNLIFPDEKEPN